MSHASSPRTERPDPTRRRILHLLWGVPVIGSVLARRAIRSAFDTDVPPSPQGAVKATSFNSTSEARALLATYPQPRYIPSGFRVTRIIHDPDLGFSRRRVPGATQLGTVAFRTDAKDPIVIYVAPSGRGERLFGTSKQPGESVSLRFADGGVAEGTYHDGWWTKYYKEARWDRTSFHSVTFARGDHWVGIRASRRSGITRPELLRIASSVA